MEIPSQIFVYGFVVAFAVMALMYSVERSSQIPNDWARQNGIRLLKAQYCWFWRGPFWLTSSKHQVVYRIQAEAGDGRICSGYVLCGSWMWGLWSNQAQVRWDDGMGPGLTLR
jgi:hypothetical protein